jgi:murein DD-endopeptidase MepM/ murein hydrolase activator NlpD
VQIILVSRRLKAARTFTIMPRHLVLAGFAFVAIVLMTSAMVSWLSVQLRLPLAEDLFADMKQEEAQKTQSYVTNNLQLMATRLGELQAKVLHMDTVGDHLANMTGLRREPAPVVVPQPLVDQPGGKGGPYVPAPMSADELQQEIDRLARYVDFRSDELIMLEWELLDQRVKNRLLPTTLPVKEATLGSFYGPRSDPFAGLRAMHEGIDFVAPTGTPVVAAADGVVQQAYYHPEFGNVIDIDHGGGLITRYAHLSRMDVKPMQLLKGGDPIGTVGTTGRSTGPHLHFEVRLHGAPQNPARFLKQSEEYALLKRR